MSRLIRRENSGYQCPIALLSCVALTRDPQPYHAEKMRRMLMHVLQPFSLPVSVIPSRDYCSGSRQASCVWLWSLMGVLTSFFQESTEEAKQWLCYARDQRAQKWQNCRRNCTNSVSIQVPLMGDLAQPPRRLCSPFSKVPGC